MSDGNKFDVTAYAQQRRHSRLPSEEMSNALLDAMQGTLVCLDNQHVIIDVSKTIKPYFGFEQTEIIGVSILLFIEEAERDSFLKFLSNTSQIADTCSIRILTAISNEYRQVKVHRKKKFNSDNIDVHSTTARYSASIGTILVLILDDSSYIDMSLYDVNKQEFYTKINLLGQIIFMDHRGAVITGYLPREIISQSIFNFVFNEDCLVKLHALWKCVTTGASKLQWRLISRSGSIVYLQTEYKLLGNHRNENTIIARNERLDSIQKAQFDELQAAWTHQCRADIKGHSSSFKLITPHDTDTSVVPKNECRICVPSLNICFSTKKLQLLNITGNVFDSTKSSGPLTIQDYVSILFDNEKYLDSELKTILNDLPSILAYAKRSNSNQTVKDLMTPDIANGEKLKTERLSSLNDLSQRKKYESDSIVRGILSNSIKYNHEQTNDNSSPNARVTNGHHAQNDTIRISTHQINQLKSNQIPSTQEAFEQQHLDFIKKYKSAKAKLESQLEQVRAQEAANGGQAHDVVKRNTILNKLAQLEHIKSRHMARRLEQKRQTQQGINQPVNNSEQKDSLNSLFPTASPTSLNSPSNVMAIDNNSTPSTLYNQSGLSYQSYYPPTPQQNPLSNYHTPSVSYDLDQISTFSQDSHTRMKTPLYDNYSPGVSLPVNNPLSNVYPYMNTPHQSTPDDSIIRTPSPFNNHHQTTSFPY